MIRQLWNLLNTVYGSVNSLLHGGTRQPLAEREEPGQQPGRQDPHHGYPFRNPREQMDFNEFLEAEQSRTTQNLGIAEITEYTRLSETVRRLTPDGLAIEESEILLKTTSGLIITSQQIIGGGQCCVCRGYSDWEHYYLCAECGLGMCRLHVCAVEGVAYCPEHARKARYELETWNLDEGRAPYDS
jgi:hypothetical protein